MKWWICLLTCISLGRLRDLIVGELDCRSKGLRFRPEVSIWCFLGQTLYFPPGLRYRLCPDLFPGNYTLYVQFLSISYCILTYIFVVQWGILYCISQHPEFFLQRSEIKSKCRAGNFQYLHILSKKNFSQVFFVSDSFIKQSQRRTFFKLKIEFLILYLISTGWIWVTKILCWRERTVPGVYWMDSW